MVYQSDSLEWTEEEEQATAQNVADMVNSPKSTVQKMKDGFCDVYNVTMDNEKKATIVNVKMDEKDPGSWRIFSGKFEQQGIGPFVDGSSFDKNLNNGKGIRHTINNKMAVQQALKTFSHGINR